MLSGGGEIYYLMFWSKSTDSVVVFLLLCECLTVVELVDMQALVEVVCSAHFCTLALLPLEKTGPF
jgi:hypothetical protein